MIADDTKCKIFIENVCIEHDESFPILEAGETPQGLEEWRKKQEEQNKNDEL